MRFMQIESVLQTKNRSEPAKNRFSVALIAAMPIYGLKNLLLQNQTANDLETWFAASGAKYYQVCSNDDPWLILTYFRQGQIWSLCFCMRKR